MPAQRLQKILRIVDNGGGVETYTIDMNRFGLYKQYHILIQ